MPLQGTCPQRILISADGGELILRVFRGPETGS